MALRIFLGWAAASLAGLVAVLAGLAIDDASTIEAADANLAALWPLWLVSGSGWAALTGVWLLLRADRAGPVGRMAVPTILGVAAVARLGVLLTHTPALSDDIYRYVFDGRNLASGVNPYLVAPADRLGVAESRWPGEPVIAVLCNNPEMHTIYLPASQLAFVATVAATPDAVEPAAAALPFRVMLTLADLALVGLLLLALRRAGRPAWWACLYAWHPLPVTEIAGSGHQDVLGVALLVAALLVAVNRPARTTAWTTLLAVAALVKPIVLPAAAFILRRQPPAVWARSLLVGVVVCVAIATPFLLTHDAEPLANLRETADRFRLKWAHFGSVYEPLLTTIEWMTPEWINDRREVLARRICTAILAAVLAILWWRPRRLRRRLPPDDAWTSTRVAMMAMILLAPAVHPWYLLWALALVPMSFGAATWVASLTITWGYAAWTYVTPEGNVEWGVPAWLMVLAWGPVYAAGAWSFLRRPLTAGGEAH